jgi:alkanesulfonate monooxygenase SsuD/methylene tetrahydromethanopterin reductase-like flavin-dependent oxidoreductase (luciferase family)
VADPFGLRAFEDHVRVVRGLLHGELVDLQLDGRPPRDVGFQMAHLGLHELEPPPVIVSAFAPSAMGVAGRLGDGLIGAAGHRAREAVGPPLGPSVATSTWRRTR